MSKAYFFIIAVVIAVIGSSACKLYQEVPPPTIIQGFVNLYDDDQNEIQNDGMLVTFWGPGPELESLTSGDGEYIIYEPPVGTYSISYDKAGLGTYTINDVSVDTPSQFVLIDFIPPLGQISLTSVSLVEVFEDPNSIKIVTTTERETNLNSQRYLRYFFSSDTDVGGANYEMYSDLIAATSIPFDYVLTLNDLAEFGFSAGERVYVRVYGESFYSNNYIDEKSGQMVFPNLNSITQPAISFIVP